MSIARRLRERWTRSSRAQLERELASALSRGEKAEAVELGRRLVAASEGAFGPDHRELGVARYALGAALLAAGDANGAMAEGLAARERLPAAAESPSRVDVAQLLASAAVALGDAATITARLRELAAAVEATSSGEARDLRLADVDTRLGLHLARVGALEEAWSHLSRALVLRRARLGTRDLAVGEALFNLATHRTAASSPDEAASRFEEAARIASEASASGAVLREAALQNLGALREEQERDDDARAAWEEALALRQARLGAEHATLRPILVRLAQLRERTGSPLVAGVLYERAHRMAEAELGLEHPITRALAEWKRSPTDLG